MHARVALSVAVLCASAVLLAGQQPPPQGPPAQTPAPTLPAQAPTFRSSVEAVRLDVSVLDAGRVPVTGLTAADFTVLEEGRPQKITTFSEVTVPDPVEPTTEWMRDVSPDIRRNDDMNDRRLILIVLDDAMMSSLRLRAIDNVKNAARAIVDQLGPSDLCAVIYTMDSRSVQEFTSDRAKLLAAIDRYAPGFGGDQELFERYSVGALLRAAEFLTDIPQKRKALFYISTGVAVNLEAAAAPKFAGKEGTGGDPVGRASYLMEQMQDVFRQAQIANVNIHSIDPGGLAGLAGDPAQSTFDPHKDFLITLATNTGGFPIVNREDYKTAIGQVFLENSDYYLLGYESDKPNDGRYRRIEVRVDRPGLTVRTRSGYYAPGADKGIKSSAGAKPGPNPLWKAISGLLPVDGLPLQVTAAPFASPDRKEGIVAVALGIIQDVNTGEARQIEHVDFLVDAFGQDGSSKSVHGLKADVALKPGVQGKVGYEVLTRINLKPGRYQLRLSAHLPSEDRSGSIYYDVDVPDFSKGAIALSGVMLNVTPALASAPRDLLRDLVPAAPTSNRYFRQKVDRVQAFVKVYQPKGGMKPVDLHTRVTDSTGAELINRVVTIPLVAFGQNREAAYGFTIPISTLKPGAYLLTFDTTMGRETARRDVRFTVW